MKKLIYFTISILLLFTPKSSFGQSDSNWVSLSSDDNYFTFKIPDTPLVIDTLNTYFCSTTIENDLFVQVYYARSDSNYGDNTSDSIDNPLLAFTAQLISSTNGTLTSFEDLYVNSTIRGKEIGLTHPTSYVDTTDTTFVFLFSRVYHNGNSLLIFLITAPEYRLNDLIAYKELFFDDIVINIPN